MVRHLVLLVLATFFVWQTIRFAAEALASRVFTATRPAHPLLVVSLPLYVLWPHWIAALGVAGATALLVALSDRLFNSSPAVPIPLPRTRTRGSLPPLP
jgi:hypothetical protein